jgi:putative oxidoreductase
MSQSQKLIRWFAVPPDNAPSATLLLRVMAGSVFLWEGILKFVYTNQGVGRFTKLGIPMPELTAHFVGTLEITGGLLFLLGLGTRMVAVPFIIEMVVAILSTKIGVFYGNSPLPRPPAPPFMGMWAVLHEIRSDWAQILVSGFLLAAGPGPISLDAMLTRWRRVATGAPLRPAAA